MAINPRHSVWQEGYMKEGDSNNSRGNKPWYLIVCSYPFRVAKPSKARRVKSREIIVALSFPAIRYVWNGGAKKVRPCKRNKLYDSFLSSPFSAIIISFPNIGATVSWISLIIVTSFTSPFPTYPTALLSSCLLPLLVLVNCSLEVVLLL